MKIASLNDGTRDGQLVVVSDDHQTQRPCTDGTLRAALDAGRLVPEFTEQPFADTLCGAVLPRATQFLDGSAYVNHVDLVRRARGAEMPERFWTDPLMYQGCSTFLGPTDDITGDPDWGIDFEAEVAVITGDVHQGVSADEAAGFVEYIMLINDISLRGLIPGELAKGFGFVQSKPPSATSPLAVTPDDCPGWDGRKLHGALCVDLNGAAFGRADAGMDMTFDFGALIAHAARTRPLPAGTVIGSGTISNRDADGGPGRPVADDGAGYSCIAEQRMVETIKTGAPVTPFLQRGNRVRIWMEDETGASIFGAIDQKVSTT
ncbi:fumarylacetoacetate (FAA) hydrolase [Litoreibacter ponti]|uniref:Fumarylacetoacetate (FAA) hydrolase n=1 Tax=Litoreibacter ponti TaxID=1510457 RepID=A0A2T6BEU3_9RHOB|nr:fumarylacetoacetate hydrolase family protein [Litoreibacter ponti]PTX54580.1 fumarylacetoacetate (FAA) hydrolase [Litoreibacter ponti]